jgi:hypothetical protein
VALTPQFIQRGLQVSLVRHDVLPSGCARAGVFPQSAVAPPPHAAFRTAGCLGGN